MSNLIKFEKLRVGKLLFDLRYGIVEVTKLNGDYPIEAETMHCTTLHYDKEGKACISHRYPMLYLKDPINVS
jgi:hypothetical protein